MSRVLNDSPSVDPRTRERVRLAIAELDYVPSPIARSLSTGRTGAIGVVVPFLTRPSAVERLRGVEAGLTSTSFDLVVFTLETVNRREAIIRLLARGGRVDGLILVSISPHPVELAQLDRTGLPTVLIDGHHRMVSRVVVDDVAGGRLAANYLLNLGHRRIGFLGDEPRTGMRFSPSHLRRIGVAAALRSVGLTFEPKYIHTGGFPRETARRAARELLALTPPPTAIICGSDVEALGVLEAARLAKVPVPDQLSIVGYDDIEIAGDLGLTTIRQPLFESGRRGVRLLLEAIGGDERRPVRELLPVNLVVRATTGPPADEVVSV